MDNLDFPHVFFGWCLGVMTVLGFLFIMSLVDGRRKQQERIYLQTKLLEQRAKADQEDKADFVSGKPMGLKIEGMGTPEWLTPLEQEQRQQAIQKALRNEPSPTPTPDSNNDRRSHSTKCIVGIPSLYNGSGMYCMDRVATLSEVKEAPYDGPSPSQVERFYFDISHEPYGEGPGKMWFQTREIAENVREQILETSKQIEAELANRRLHEEEYARWSKARKENEKLNEELHQENK